MPIVGGRDISIRVGTKELKPGGMNEIHDVYPVNPHATREGAFVCKIIGHSIKSSTNLIRAKSGRNIFKITHACIRCNYIKKVDYY